MENAKSDGIKKEEVAAAVNADAVSVKRGSKRQTVKNVLIWVFFPVGLGIMLYRYLVSRFKLNITTKAMLLFSAMFGIAFLFYAFFLLIAVGSRVFSDTPIDGPYFALIITVSAILMLTFFALFIFIGVYASRNLLHPIKTMITKIDEISADSLHNRLDPVDTQDELMELTDRINLMLDSIENSFKQQKYFVSDASHELRTPISVVHGYAELLKRWGKNDPVVLDEAIDAIFAESNNMKHIVEQLLYLTKLGSFDFAASEFNLSEVVEDIVSGYSMTHPDKNFTTECDINLSIVAVRAAVVELIRIITDNATKYTAEKGNISIVCRKHKSRAEIIISDDGIGIAAKEIPRIFDRFYRCDKSRGRDSGSTGLGLAIAKSIAEMLNGSITCESELGIGTTFTITIPLEET